MRQNELQYQLRPRLCIQFRCETGKRPFGKRSDQPTTAERSIHKHNQSALSGDREQPIFGRTVNRIIGQLN